MSKANYFYCLAKSEGCSKDMFGIIACSTCEKDGECSVCGRQETSFCEKCVNRKDDKKCQDVKNSEMWTGNIVGGRRKTRRIKQEESE